MDRCSLNRRCRVLGRNARSCRICCGADGSLSNSESRKWNRLDQGVSAGVAESTRRHIAWLEAEIAQLEKEYQEALQGSAQLAQRAALYRTAPGVGPLLQPPWWAWRPGPGTAAASGVRDQFVAEGA